LFTSGQIVGLIGFVMIGLVFAVTYLAPWKDSIFILLVLVLFGGAFCVLYAICENVIIPK
jgi:hypothetical protein